MVLRIEQDGRLRRITLAAAEKRNVLDQEMADALLVGFSDAATDDATGAILLQADGQVFAQAQRLKSEKIFSLRCAP